MVGDKNLYFYGCKREIHKTAEVSAHLAANFKCQICGRIELKAKDGSYYQGCNMFSSHQEVGIIAFHDLCSRLFESKMRSGAKPLNTT